MRNGADVIAFILFAFMAIVHLARYLCHFDVVLGSFVVPELVSPLAFVFFGLLAAWIVRPRVIPTL